MDQFVLYVMTPIPIIMIITTVILVILIITKYLDRPKFKRGDTIQRRFAERWEHKDQIVVIEVGNSKYHLDKGGGYTSSADICWTDDDYEKVNS
jgi:hypothetical protein